MPTTSEDRLVVGDVTVVADLYRVHGPFIHTISQQLVGAAADRLTQQVFVEAWRDRHDYNPSQGTVRNWLIRRTRERVSKPSAEAEFAVDRMVVADCLRRMDPIRRQVLMAGAAASDVDELADELDHPAATVRGHLRRGTDLLQADLADSRSDGGAEGLMEIMTGPLDLDLSRPPEVVWQAIAAELGLDPTAVTSEDLARSMEANDGSAGNGSEASITADGGDDGGGDDGGGVLDENDPAGNGDSGQGTDVAGVGDAEHPEVHPGPDGGGDHGGDLVDGARPAGGDAAGGDAGAVRTAVAAAPGTAVAGTAAGEGKRPGYLVPAVAVLAAVLLVVVLLMLL